MAKFVLLINWTDQGIRHVGDTTKRSQQARTTANELGGSLEELWTIGRYDEVVIGDFPNDEAVTVFAMKMGALGFVRTETLRAFTTDEVDAMLKKMD